MNLAANCLKPLRLKGFVLTEASAMAPKKRPAAKMDAISITGGSFIKDLNLYELIQNHIMHRI